MLVVYSLKNFVVLNLHSSIRLARVEGYKLFDEKVDLCL